MSPGGRDSAEPGNSSTAAGDEPTPAASPHDDDDQSHVTRVDELLARLDTPEAPRRSRRRDRVDDTEQVPAAALLASHGGSSPAGATTDDDDTAELPSTPAGSSRTSLIGDGSTSVLPVIGRSGDVDYDPAAVRAALQARSRPRPDGGASPAPAAQPVSPPTRPRQRHRHPFLNYGAHLVVAAISAFILLVTGVYWTIRVTGDASLRDNSVNIGSDDNSLVTARPTTPTTGGVVGPAPVYPAENFLLVGSDTRAGDNNIDSSEGELEGVANTDSIMLLHVSGDRQRIYAVSLPRDLWVPNVDCNTYDQATNSYGGPADSNGLDKQHINSFYGVGGPKCLVDAVENLTQLNITHYIQIDFSGFQAMVDAIGGITVNVCRPIIDETLGTILGTAGEQRISGDIALSLARARKVEGDPESDLSRIHRQQMILSTILRTVKSAGVLLDPGKLSGFVDAFTQNTTTAGVDFDQLMSLAESLGDLDPAKVTFFTVPTVADPEDTDRGSMFIDPDTSGPLLDAIRNDLPLPGVEQPTQSAEPTQQPTSAAEPPPTVTVAPDAVNVHVVNATGRSGVASAAADALNGLGFDVTEDDLFTEDATDSGATVHYSAGNEAAALTVAASVSGATLTPTEGLGDVVELRLGTASPTPEFVAVSVGGAIPAELAAQLSGGAVPQPAETGGSSEATSIAQVNASDTSCL